MKFTAKAEYACLAVIALAQRRSEGRPTQIREIARGQRIPHSVLTQILWKLKSAGLVRSARGSCGGYWLARPPEEITLDQIILVIDGNGPGMCKSSRRSSQALTRVWDQIRDAERRLLNQTSIAQLVRREAADPGGNGAGPGIIGDQPDRRGGPAPRAQDHSDAPSPDR